LIFEEDFSPLLEIRWQKMAKKRNRRAKAIFKRIRQADETLQERTIPPEFSFLEANFHVTCYGRLENLLFDTCVCICRHCQTILLLKLSNEKKSIVSVLVDSLKSVSCPCKTAEQNFWSIQDFQFLLPSDYSLTDYSLAAGLTRISFHSARTVLHTCKLAPADSRLNDQPLEQILRSLVDIPDLQVQLSDERQVCEGHRAPTIGKQITLRLQRKKPFIWSRIRHDTKNNRLLAVVIESIQPISPETGPFISNHYEIIQV